MKFDTEHDRFVVRQTALQHIYWDVALGITACATIRTHYDKYCTIIIHQFTLVLIRSVCGPSMAA